VLLVSGHWKGKQPQAASVLAFPADVMWDGWSGHGVCTLPALAEV
jgi:hypothetical protein